MGFEDAMGNWCEAPQETLAHSRLPWDSRRARQKDFWWGDSQK